MMVYLLETERLTNPFVCCFDVGLVNGNGTGNGPCPIHDQRLLSLGVSGRGWLGSLVGQTIN